MSKDILEKGAIVQRDKETFAIAPHIAGGIIDPAGFGRLRMWLRSIMPKF